MGGAPHVGLFSAGNWFLTVSALTLYILPVICIGLMIGASLHDLVTRTIPNGLALVLAGVGLIAATVGGHFPGALLAAAGVFIVSALCWRRGWMGGGDVKLLGAATLSVPPFMVPTFIVAVALAGGALAIVYLVTSWLPPPRASHRPDSLLARAVRVERWRASRGGPLPYACAIAAGAVFVFTQGHTP